METFSSTAIIGCNIICKHDLFSYLFLRILHTDTVLSCWLTLLSNRWILSLPEVQKSEIFSESQMDIKAESTAKEKVGGVLYNFFFVSKTV